jgi:hypothetical protein
MLPKQDKRIVRKVKAGKKLLFQKSDWEKGN